MPFFPWPMLKQKVPPPPPPPSGGGIVTRFGTAPSDLSGWIAQYWPDGTWVGAAEVSYIESGWRHDAILDTRPLAGGLCNVPIVLRGGTLPALSEYSIGYFQLNLCAHLTISVGDALDGAKNTAFAGDLYRADGWRPWWSDAVTLGLV